MARIYTVSTGLANIPVGASTAFTVPAGYVYVLRDWSVTCQDPAGGLIVVSVGPNGNVALQGFTFTGKWQTFHWSGRVAMNAGDDIKVSNNTAAICSFVGTSYALTPSP